MPDNVTPQDLLQLVRSYMDMQNVEIKEIRKDLSELRELIGKLQINNAENKVKLAGVITFISAIVASLIKLLFDYIKVNNP